MRLGLCSGALPGAPLEDLMQAAATRGLSVVELREEDLHGVAPEMPMDAIDVVARAARGNVGISAYRAGSRNKARRLARLSELLNLPILVDGGPGDIRQRVALALRIADTGGRSAIVVGGNDVLVQAAEAEMAGLEIAWEADPLEGIPPATTAALLDDHGMRLRHVRLRGGGPEADLHEGRGIGGMAARLALGGYTGSLILTPSSARYRIAWQSWLGRRGGWGCGGKDSAPELVTLSGPASGELT